MAIRIAAMDLRTKAGEILARIRYAGEQFVVERNGEPVAAIISIEDYRRLVEAQEETQLPRVTEDDPIWSIVGAVATGDTDVSANHDHYLYGFPRRQ